MEPKHMKKIDNIGEYLGILSFKDKEYCADCLNVFNPEELVHCICVPWSSSERTIVTKSGVRHEEIEYKYCKNCLKLNHEHKGQTFI